jgi:hypothetical protein
MYGFQWHDVWAGRMVKESGVGMAMLHAVLTVLTVEGLCSGGSGPFTRPLKRWEGGKRMQRTWPIDVKRGISSSLVHWLRRHMRPSSKRPAMQALLLATTGLPWTNLSTASLKEEGATRPTCVAKHEAQRQTARPRFHSSSWQRKPHHESIGI